MILLVELGVVKQLLFLSLILGKGIYKRIGFVIGQDLIEMHMHGYSCFSSSLDESNVNLLATSQ